MTAAMTFDVTRTRRVRVEEFADEDGCGLHPIGWYYFYDGESEAHGPYRTMDAALSAAERGV